jgi:1-acyl-sn-glycerol-3-phosphate acyltransferase
MKRLHRFSPLFEAFLWWGTFWHRIYYRKFVVKGRNNIPSLNPVIFAASHQNALMDALAVIFASRRQIVFLARADIFRNKIAAGILRELKILPVYRIRDGYTSLGRNQETFDEVYEVLRHGRPVGIFPEGFHLGRKKLKPLRKGIARMAFQAEEKSDFSLGLQIVPTGIDYSDYFRPGSDLLVQFGPPIRVSDYRDLYLENPSAAILRLRSDVALAMKELMIDIQHDEQYHTILSASESLAGTELKLRGMKVNLFNRFLIIKELSSESPSLQPNTHNPGRKAILISLLLLLIPVFIPCLILNLAPAWLSSRLAKGMADPHLAVSVRFGAGLILFPAWYLVLFITGILFLPLHWAFTGVMTVLLPFTALFALYYLRAASKIFSTQ